MRCIICKADSSSSKSEEHIVPASFGNTDFTLPPGIVCDTCNNYLSREVEKPFLDSRYIVERRQFACIPNKRGRIPMLDGFACPPGIRISIGIDESDGSRYVVPTNENDNQKWVHFLQSEQHGGSFYFPVGVAPDTWVTSRFLAKIGLEVLAQRVMHDIALLDELVDHPGLDELREHIRYGGNRTEWPFSRRPIYDADRLFRDLDAPYTVAHEYDFLVTDGGEYFIVLAIFGDEYALNLGGRCLAGYTKWLNEHYGASPLYFGKNLASNTA